MTNSYSTPLTYGPQNQALTYEGMTEKKASAFPYAIGGAVVGAGGGGYLGYKTNPFITKSGEAKDTFVKSVTEKYVDKADDAYKKTYNQTKEIMKKIDAVKTPDELKTLFNDNSEAAKKILGDYESFLNNIDKDNLSQNKKTIKEKIEAGNNTELQDMKNKIKGFWDKDKKVFVDSSTSGDNKVLEAIKEAKKGVKAKLIAKYAAIGAVVTSLAAYIAHEVILAKKSQATQQDVQI